jgi:hypothetical protein
MLDAQNEALQHHVVVDPPDPQRVLAGRDGGETGADRTHVLGHGPVPVALFLRGGGVRRGIEAVLENLHRAVVEREPEAEHAAAVGIERRDELERDGEVASGGQVDVVFEPGSVGDAARFQALRERCDGAAGAAEVRDDAPVEALAAERSVERGRIDDDGVAGSGAAKRIGGAVPARERGLARA